MTDQTEYPTTPPNEIETRKGQTYVFVDPGTTFSDLPRIHRTTKAHYARFGFAGCLQLGDGSSRTFGDGEPYTVPSDGKHYHWLEVDEASTFLDRRHVQPDELADSLWERMNEAIMNQSLELVTPATDPDDLMPETEAEAEVVAAFDQLSKAVVKAMRTKEGGAE